MSVVAPAAATSARSGLSGHLSCRAHSQGSGPCRTAQGRPPPVTPNLRIKRQAQPCSKPSMFVQSFGLAWLFGLRPVRRGPLTPMPCDGVAACPARPLRPELQAVLGVLAVVPASSVCWRSCWLAVVRGCCCTSVLYAAGLWPPECQRISRARVTPCPAALLPGLSAVAPTMSPKIIPCISPRDLNCSASRRQRRGLSGWEVGGVVRPPPVDWLTSGQPHHSCRSSRGYELDDVRPCRPGWSRPSPLIRVSQLRCR